MKEKISKWDCLNICLSYIALVDFRTCCINKIDDNELFKFETRKYINFTNFLEKYTLSSQIKEFYEENLIIIRTEYKNYYKNDYNIYLYLIIKFGGYDILYPNKNKGK